MNDHLISVIIPVYNTAEYLPRCLDSVLSSTYRDLEVICINDGSQDNSLEVLYSYASKDSRIRIINQKNAGVSAARNRGLDEATGEYIAFVDSDDWIHSRYFEVLLHCARRYGVDMSACRTPDVTGMVDDCLVDIDKLTVDLYSGVPLLENCLGVWGRLYKRSLIGNSRFDKKIRLSEDTVFNLDMISKLDSFRMTMCECPMYYYFTRSNSAVHTLEPKETVHLIRWYVAHLDSAPTEQIKNYYLIDAMKRLFIWRYNAMFSDDPEGTGALKELLGKTTEELRKAGGISMFHKLLYMVMARVPFAYRLFRIANDPTLLKWEKLQREKMRAEKKK